MTLRTLKPQTTSRLERPIDVMSRMGDHALFYGKALAGIPYAVTVYRRDIVRLIAEISMGTGALALMGEPS